MLEVCAAAVVDKSIPALFTLCFPKPLPLGRHNRIKIMRE